ncbi:hypothetical protein ACCO45_007913 [Purpureocillium lilacinum]|uniref:Uncharacterized protein n=1 Tax=Purpureocillium lilacinum TaxID=33203 RepID=A0ACC4DPW1_PURLI
MSIHLDNKEVARQGRLLPRAAKSTNVFVDTDTRPSTPSRPDDAVRGSKRNPASHAVTESRSSAARSLASKILSPFHMLCGSGSSVRAPNPTSPDGGTAGSPTRAAQSWAHQGTQRRVDWDQQTPSRIAARHDTRIPTRGDANCCRQDEPCAVQREARGAWASEATWRLLQPLRPALAVLPLRGVCQVTVRMLVETLDLRARIEVEMSRILICGDIVVEV